MSDDNEQPAAAAKKVKAAPTCKVLIVESVKRWASTRTVVRTVTKKVKNEETGEAEDETTEVENKLTIGGDVAETLDSFAVKWLRNYGEQLAEWHYYSKFKPFVTVRVKNATDFLDSGLDAMSKRRAISNVCLILSISLRTAQDSLTTKARINADNLHPLLIQTERSMLIPMSNGPMTVDQDALFCNGPTAVVAPEAKVKTVKKRVAAEAVEEDETVADSDPAPKKKAKKTEAAPAPAPAPKKKAPAKKKKAAEPVDDGEDDFSAPPVQPPAVLVQNNRKTTGGKTLSAPPPPPPDYKEDDDDTGSGYDEDEGYENDTY